MLSGMVIFIAWLYSLFGAYLYFRLVIRVADVQNYTNMNRMSNVMRGSSEYDFGRNFPVKSVAELKITPEIGIFVVEATVIGVSQMDPWWYAICGCHKIIEGYLGLFYCINCKRRDFLIIPK
jgi:hypothetical protein